MALMTALMVLVSKFWAHTISKEELRKQNTALQVEVEAIKWVELSEEEDKNDNEEVVILRSGRRLTMKTMTTTLMTMMTLMMKGTRRSLQRR